MMKLRLRRHERRKTLKLELADTSTLHDLRRMVNTSAPSSVHLSLNRKDELLATSPEDTLQSLGITSGDLIYFSPDPSAFVQDVYSSMEGSDTMHVEKLDVEVAGSKRVSETFFLKIILLEKCGDSELTTLASSVHAVMLDSGFVLLNNHGGSEKFSFSKDFLTLSLRYTLPELVTDTKTTIEYVTVRFHSLSDTVEVYRCLSGHGEKVLNLDKNRFVPVFDSVMDTFKFEKQAASSSCCDVRAFWRMVKDGICTPLLIGLCDKSGLELPPCLMSLPTELKLKILESIPGTSVAKMACVCSEMRCLASDNDLWRLKYFEETKEALVVVNGTGDSSVNWKVKFASYRRKQRIRLPKVRRPFQKYLRRPSGCITCRGPRGLRRPYYFNPNYYR